MPLSREDSLPLQRTAGNMAMVRMLQRAGYAYAQHQHGPGCGHHSGPATESGATPVQRSTVHDVLRATGRPLDDTTRTDMEGRLGADFSDVRIHDDSAARASAAEVGARAYTSGSHVVIGEGGADRHTLAHELTHVIQQRQGPVAGTDNGAGLAVSDPSDLFEREAEAVAHEVVSGGPVTALAKSPAPAHAAGQDVTVQRMFTWARVQHQARTFRNDLASIRSAHRQPEPTQEAANAWGQALDTLEHEVYAWFTANATANDNARNLMAAVMDEIQQEHHRYIEFVITHALQPYMTGLADDDAEAMAQMTWTRLSTNTGISVADQGEGNHPTTPEFRTSVHSMNARLMSRPMGRGLLQGLAGVGNAGAPGVSISAIDSNRLAVVGEALGFAPGTYHDDAQVGPVNPDLGRALLQDGSLVPGEPSESAMSLEQNYHDSVPGRADPETQRRPQDPVTPAFITYGHELIHALHNQRGLSLTQAVDARAEELETVGIDSGHPEATVFLLSQLMENYTTENGLRDEHGLPHRTSY
ncbi:DUF4157 domain-containing protein [Streptomyces prasinus]|uniref:DUF4157 domain-containing protein n=3 Tax=Streptomyces TaxID=1883 RepID=A0ABX6APU6_9ACTN|nr:DUF4157 domain-containing protein [Streptomyces prasinus]